MNKGTALRFFGILLAIVFFVMGWFTNTTRRKTIPERIERILEECRKRDPTPNYIRCFKGEDTRKIIDSVGVSQTMSVLGELFGEQGEIGGVATTSCHDFAHLIGEIAIENDTPLGETIGSCTSACSYGCVHGAMLAAMRKDRSIVDTIPTLCSMLTDPELPEAQRVACIHGLGHGLAALYTLDITQSIEACTSLPTYEAQFHCGRGVFMEIIDSPVLEHPRMELPEDIISFCRSFEGIFSDACFANAGSREFARSGDIEKAITNCDASPENRDTCMSYLGQNVYFLLGKDVIRALAVCQKAKEELGACATGVLMSIAYVEEAQQGKVLCETISRAYHNECYGKLGDSVAFVHGEVTRQEFCGQFAPEEASECLKGRKGE